MALTLAAAARTDKAAHRPNETDAGDGVIPVDADGIPPLAKGRISGTALYLIRARRLRRE